MKDRVILILNRKIREMQCEVETSKKAQDLIKMGVGKRIIQILSNLIQEIQDSV